MKHRILILSTVHPAGHPRYMMKLARGLASEGFDVEVWARGESRPELPESLHLHLLPKAGKVRRMFDLPAALKRALTGEHDLVIVVPPETVPVGLIAKVAGKKVMWDVEEDSTSGIRDSDWMPAPLRRPVAKVFDLVERLAGVTLDACTLAEDAYRGRFHAARHAEVIHNYPPRPTGPDLSHGEVAAQRWNAPGPRLIYVGVVTDHRGILDTIETVALLEDRLPDITFDVLGSIPSPSYRRQLEEARERLKNPARVTLHGQVPFDRLSDHLSRAQIGVLPLWNQPNFIVSEPTKVFEYCLAGLPMVVGDVPIWRRIMDAADAGEAAPPCDRVAWADAIERLWQRGPKDLEAAGRRAHDLIVEQNLFWEREQHRLATLCRAVIEGTVS